MAQLPPNHPISPATQTAGVDTPNDPPKPKFTPRKEFIQERRVLSSFCLLTLSGPGLVRLYSFPQPAIDALRRLFDQHNLILGIRHDIPKLFYEFALEGKPWANPKNIKTEKLLVDILHEVFRSGYHLLSSLDYGREQDDRIAIAFSKPIHVPALLATPQSNGSAISLHQCTHTPFALSFLSSTTVRVVGAPLRSTPAILQAVRVAWPRGVLYERKVGDATYEFKFKGYKWYQEDNFGTDSLHLTLGLLKTLDHHGFSLLTSLSLTSRSRVKDLWIFSGILPGDNYPDTSMTDPTASSVDLKKEVTPQTHATNVLSPSPLPQSETRDHFPRKLPNPPGHNPENNGFPPHVRSASDSAVSSLHKSFHFSKGYTALLRRTPRKQTHVSDAHDVEYPLDQSLFPNVSPDKSPSVGSVDLTGIGLRTMDRVNCTPDAMRSSEFRPTIFCPQPERTMFPILSQSSPYPVFPNSGRDRRASNDSRPNLYPQDTSRHRAHSSEGRHFRSSSLLGPSGYSPRVSSAHPQSSHAPPPLSRTVSGQDVRPVPPADVSCGFQKEKGDTPPEESEFKLPEFARSSTPPSLNFFRDSAFSSGIRQSLNIPITWTGKSPEPLDHKLLNGVMEKEGDHWSQPHFHPSRPEYDRASTGPFPPGGWTSTPRDERGDASTMFPPTIREQPSLEREDRGSPRNAEDVTLGMHMGTVSSRSPERIDPDLYGVRKSEAASIGVLPNGKSPKNRPNSKEKGKEKPKPVRRDTVTSGWVMVNVESHGKSKESNGVETASGDKKSGTSSGKKTAGPGRPEHARSVSDPRVLTQSTSPQTGVAPSSMSPAAKAIVMIDAQGSKERQEKSSAKSGLRKLLNRGKTAAANDSPSPAENSKATLQRKTPETSGTNGNASKSTMVKEPRQNKAATMAKPKVKRRVTERP